MSDEDHLIAKVDHHTRAVRPPSISRGQYPIVVEGLVNRFGEQTIHDGLDLKVRKGEILGVVGGSGTGKSVLMRSIIGLQMPEDGEIQVFGLSTDDLLG